jgi:hypothetical protein
LVAQRSSYCKDDYFEDEQEYCIVLPTEQQDEFLETDPSNNSIYGEEEVMPMINDLHDLFEQSAINEIILCIGS